MTLPRSVTLRGRKFKLTHLDSMTDYGLCDDVEQMRIWIRLKQKEKDLLETIIHECLHGCLPDITEEAVTQTAEDITKLLWRYGYRKSNAL